MRLNSLKFACCLALLTQPLLGWAVESGSTGVDGAFAPTSDASFAIPADGILNFTTFNVREGVTVKFSANAANTPVFILVQGDAVIDGTIDISGADGDEFDASPPAGFAGGLPAPTQGGTGQGLGGGVGGDSSDGGNGGSYGSVGFAGTSNSFAVREIYGSSVLQPLLGGSGGGAIDVRANEAGARGGGGGGAMLLAVSGTLTVNGNILANGGSGGVSQSLRYGAGGGSGGAVRLIASTLSGTGTIDFRGGDGGEATSTGAQIFGGGAGGNGRARLEADAYSFTGEVIPLTAVVSGPLPIFPANLPSVRITSVAGVTVSSNPVGDSDVVLPSSVLNPVTIGLSATDVPLGTTIDVIITPTNSSLVTVNSSALTGTVANSSATAEVTLPTGASTIVAAVSFSVSGSLASLYSPYANGEMVANVELKSTLGQGSSLLLTTEAGNTYTVNPGDNGF